MAEKFKKIDKEFLLTDDSVNCYGFRLLTSGYLIDEYKKNPIGFHMHGGREEGILVRWEDLRSEGNAVYGKPTINLTHPRGQRTVDEIENGFLNAASVGHFVVLAASVDPADMLEGQTGATMTKWYNRECSLVDIPGNFNALNKLYDKDDKEINLADLTNNSLPNMKQIFMTAASIAALNLKADTDQASVDTAINDLVAKAARVDGLQNELAAANTAKTTVETELANLKATTVTEKVETIIADGLKANKLTAAVAADLKADYKDKPEALKKLVDNMQPYKSITAAIDENKGKLTGLAAKSWDELDASGGLESLKASDLEAFKTKFKEKFSKDYGS